MIVLKFGGTSVGGSEAIKRVGAIVQNCLDRKPVIVLSAVGGVTDRLFRLSELALAGADWSNELDALVQKHREILAELGVETSILDELMGELREMLTETTRSGTARRAFRTRRGGPLLGSIQVAGKTGSISGKNPDGRYEWFIGVAPADSPRIAIAAVLVQGDLYWRTASQIAADVLHGVFCVKGRCAPEHAERFARIPVTAAALARVTAPRTPGDRTSAPHS